tara:strand:+ start:549 stop:755 length:207 start_codon:yes stop_codon:yes gene_type:complete
MDKLNIEGELLNEKSLSKLLDISIWTLRHWRYNDKGPKFIKMDNSRIRYPKKNINEWWQKQIGNKDNE